MLLSVGYLSLRLRGFNVQLNILWHDVTEEKTPIAILLLLVISAIPSDTKGRSHLVLLSIKFIYKSDYSKSEYQQSGSWYGNCEMRSRKSDCNADQ